MKIFGMGGFELVIILIVILLIFGPKNLPKLGSALGKTMSNLRSGMNEGKKKDEAEASEDVKAAEASDAKPAEIEGEVESVEEVAQEEPTAEEPEAVDVIDEPVASEEADEAPKKVRRVVKKKVTTEE